MKQAIVELNRLRRNSRLLLIAQRSSLIMATILTSLLILIGLDFLFRLPAELRLVGILCGTGGLIWAAMFYLGPVLNFSPSLIQLALRVEQTLPSLAGRLASSVEFARAGIDQSNPLAARSIRDTQARLAGQSFSGIINTQRTLKNLGTLVVAVSAVTACILLNPTAAATGLQRWLLPYSDSHWPARTGVESLMNEVVPDNDVHPRGQALPLRAKVTKGPEDQQVEAVYRLQLDHSTQPWIHVVLTAQGRGIQERLVDSNAESIELYFQTDDAQTRPQTIRFIQPPAVDRATLHVKPPEYAADRVAPVEIELGPGVDERAVTENALLIGSDITLELYLNKEISPPLADTLLRAVLNWEGDNLPTLMVNAQSPRTWTLHWTLAGTRSLSIQLVDEYNIGNLQSASYRINAVADLPPSVTITQPQSDEAVLATAIVPLSTEATDDVAVDWLAMEVALNAGDDETDIFADPIWQRRTEADATMAKLSDELDLSALDLSAGDVVFMTGVAQDIYELNGRTHEPARSALRRLRIIGDNELATQLRRQLGAVRQNAIRIETLQAELQDDVIDDSVQPGVNRAQARIARRITQQREALKEIEQRLQTNRLDDSQLSNLLDQSGDLLDYAGRAANQAVEAIEQRAEAMRETTEAPDFNQQSNQSTNDSQKPGTSNQTSNNSGNSETQHESAPRDNEGSQPQSNDDEQDNDGRDSDQSAVPQLREPAAEDQSIVDAQQEVREELADLIELLDRDEDTWVMTRQLENLLDEQSQVEAATNKLGEQTIGRDRQELSKDEQTELDRIAEHQRDLADKAQKLIDDLRKRAQAMEEVDPQSAAGMRAAADTGEQQELDREMEKAAQQAEDNQMRNAQQSQASARSTLQRMLGDMQETKRARAEQLQRQIASLIESIQRLVTIQETELTQLAKAIHSKDFTGRDRAMIRLNQNTQAVAAEARAAGQETRRVARVLDRAADAQGAAVTALRAQPIAFDNANEAENRSLELLNEAKALAEEVKQQVEEDEVQRQREELIDAYSQLAQKQLGIREDTLTMAGIEELDRRQLMDVRRLGNAQEDIRRELDELQQDTSEIMQSRTFSRVHEMIDSWSANVSQKLIDGEIDVEVTDQQHLIADSIGRLITALEEAMTPPEEFVADSGGGGGGGGGGPQPLIPPVAELKLLRGMQEQVYDQTRSLDSRDDLDAAQRRQRLRDVGNQQRDLLDLGRRMLEELQQRAGPAENSSDSKEGEEQTDQNEPQETEEP